MAVTPLDRLELTGPYRLQPKRQDEIRNAASELGFERIAFAPQNASNAESWLRELGAALQLPPHYGGNFDALYDCLCDPEAINSQRLLVEFPDTRALDEEQRDTLIAVLQAVSDEWRDSERYFWALFSESGIELDALPAPKA